MPEASVIAVVVVALAFNYINGFHDTANAIATSVLTKALSMTMAILMAAVLNLAGAFVSEAVADTIGKGIVDPQAVTHGVVMAALLGAISWNVLTWALGLPSSSSHALIGGIIGATVLAHSSWTNVGGTIGLGVNYGIFKAPGLEKILVALVLSPVLGFVVGLLLMVVLSWLFRAWAPSLLNRWFRILQVGSAGFMAFSHGGNDAQKAMGIITMELVAAGILPSFHIPIWVKVACAASMALGTALGGWRIIKTIGRNVVELKPIHGFAAETGAAAVIQIATHLGAPISTTHVISSAIMGVGSSRRVSAVRWKVVGNIITAWVLTIPASAIMAMIAYDLLGWCGSH
jgi:inorganic phosphate transporter, PiT family